MRLAGKNAIVTGGAAGIGKAIALALANEGADVAIADVQVEKAAAVAEQIRAMGRRAVSIQCDVGDSTQVDAMVSRANADLGGIHILVNNAAIISAGTFWEVSDETWNKIIRNNLSSVFYCSRAVARLMIAQKQGGRIINMSSIHATLSEPTAGPYTAAKGGIEAFSRTMATELAPYKILVNCVAPGATYSELTTPMYTDSVKKALFQRVPLKEIAQPEWIAAGVVFLASDDARYMTGQVLTLDGGYVMDGSLPGASYWTE
ncbi:MAG: 3-oxoacyl-ACP reductase FabG [Chloroflexi bacterium]|nr:3-oxoacyl-ACP reductase FabG [Chloroflexota bacterium]MCL5274812.1 3-oxoacyl-ACP reductase FabG [Chloroflexota bacterium]